MRKGCRSNWNDSLFLVSRITSPDIEESFLKFNGIVFSGAERPTEATAVLLKQADEQKNF